MVCLVCLLDTRLLIYWSASFSDFRYLRQPGMLSRNVNLTSFSGDTVPLRLVLRMRFFSFFLWMNALHPQLTGQPVLIGGTMGTCSYVLTGTEQGMTETFGTTCHGAVSQEVISGMRLSPREHSCWRVIQCVIPLLVIQAENSLASSPYPGKLQGRSICLLLSSCDYFCRNLGDTAFYKSDVTMKMCRISFFYKILIPLN